MQRLGIKTSWRDVAAMAALARKHDARVLEYQMLPGDLERHSKEVFDAFLPYRREFELRVHQPETYEHDGQLTFLDISSPDPAARAHSLAHLGECARFAMELRAKALIIHPGGIWVGGPAERSAAGGPAQRRREDPSGPGPEGRVGIWHDGEVGGSPELLRDSLLDLPKHVKVFLENMPHFYDARSFAALKSGHSPAGFRIPGGLKQVDDLVDGYVLDISHAFLAVPQGSEAVVRAFLRELGARILHVHANGSRRGIGSAGEGTPFSDSDYGAQLVREVLSGVSPGAVIVPEIMDGHLDGGRKFDEGLAFLRPLLV